jgi:hypothetical protein
VVDQPALDRFNAIEHPPAEFNEGRRGSQMTIALAGPDTDAANSCVIGLFDEILEKIAAGFWPSTVDISHHVLHNLSATGRRRKTNDANRISLKAT